MEIKAKQCPNCNGKNFMMTEEPSGVSMMSSRDTGNNTFEIDRYKTLNATPNICEQCGYVMLFVNV